MRLAALEAYVKEVGEESPQDLKKRKKKGKGVKKAVHTRMTT